MKLVIDIDEYTYSEVKQFVAEGIFDYNGINAYAFKSIANATPLEEVLQEIKKEVRRGEWLYDVRTTNRIIEIIDKHISGKVRD